MCDRSACPSKAAVYSGKLKSRKLFFWSMYKYKLMINVGTQLRDLSGWFQCITLKKWANVLQEVFEIWTTWHCANSNPNYGKIRRRIIIYSWEFVRCHLQAWRFESQSPNSQRDQEISRRETGTALVERLRLLEELRGSISWIGQDGQKGFGYSRNEISVWGGV